MALTAKCAALCTVSLLAYAVCCQVFNLMRKDPFRRFMLSDLYKQFVDGMAAYDDRIANEEKAEVLSKHADLLKELNSSGSLGLGRLKLKASGAPRRLTSQQKGGAGRNSRRQR